MIRELEMKKPNNAISNVSFEVQERVLLVGGAWGIHRSFLMSRDPRLARYIESSFRTTPPYGVHTFIHLHSRVTGALRANGVYWDHEARWHKYAIA